jgi:hypothetical protein
MFLPFFFVPTEGVRPIWRPKICHALATLLSMWGRWDEGIAL